MSDKTGLQPNFDLFLFYIGLSRLNRLKARRTRKKKGTVFHDAVPHPEIMKKMTYLEALINQKKPVDDYPLL